MDTLRKYLGILWMLLGLLLGAILFLKAYRILLNGVWASAEDYVFWVVVLIVFIPVIVGLILFGYYAFRDEYSSGSR